MKSETGPPKVFISSRESVCDECGEELGHHAWIVLAGEAGRCAWGSCSDSATGTRPAGKWPAMSAGFERSGGGNEGQRPNLESQISDLKSEI